MKKNQLSITILAAILITAISIFAINKEKTSDKKKTTNNTTKQTRAIDKTICSNKTNQQQKTILPTQKQIVYKALNKREGIIGNFKNTKSDNPSDNIFHIIINKEITPETKVFLEYELYGLQDYTSVCRSINDQLNSGGFLVKKSEGWSRQCEEINYKLLKQGENIIRFTVPENAEYGYKVKNVMLTTKKSEKNNDRRLVVNQPNTSTFFQKYGYLQGFVSGNGSEKAELKVNNNVFTNNNGNFEGLIRRNTSDSGAWKATVTAVFEDGMQLKAEVNYQNPIEFDYTFNLNQQINKTVILLQPDKELTFTHKGIILSGDTQTVKTAIQISATSLRSVDMPPMSSGMVNVTGSSNGYRLLPHGTAFNKNISIALKYDTTLLPKGYRASDIYTFYFDEKHNNWIQIPRDTFDIANNTIISHTNHFSDYINAIIKLPELPETQAYTPTTLKDIKAANPLAGLNLISPPSANNMGTANISFPIEIPAGRQGMQPSLALQYNSGGGNGWLGVGWDLSIPAITVETRWGVPTYSPYVESEDYLISGEQIAAAKPDGVAGAMVHRAAFVFRDTAQQKQFAPRIEGAFNKIIRHGNSPKNYWWTVTDRNGVTNYYGKRPNETVILPEDVLRDDNGNIAHWALTETRDLNGNFILYEYDTVQSTGLDSGVVKGRQIYLEKIVYTNSNNYQNGMYSVEFERSNDSVRRADMIINGRLGFKEVTAHLLKVIKVRYNGNNIRKYNLIYKKGAFFKTLLCSILEENQESLTLNSNISSKYLVCDNIRDNSILKGTKRHIFEYFEDNNSSRYSTEVSIPCITDNIGNGTICESVFKGCSLLGGSKSMSSGFGIGTDVGVGINPFNKNFTAGGNYDRNKTNSNGTVSFIDIDGDGFLDKVFMIGDEIWYRKMIKENNNYVFKNAERIFGIGGFLKENSTTKTWGWEAHAGSPPLSGYTGGEKGETKSFTTTYFADVNADGLVDIIHNYIAYINVPFNGVPFFTPITSEKVYIGGSTCDYLLYNGTINDSILIQDGKGNKIGNDDFTHETVRMWIAPYDGNINVSAPIKLIEDTSTLRKNSYYADGVRYFIQKNNINDIDDTISSKNYNVKNIFINYSVNKGDRIYFRLYSNNYRRFDNVIWDPQITYLNPDTLQTDANNKKIYSFKASEDFLLSTKQTVNLPFNGSFRIRGTINAPALSDSIHFRINKFDGTNYTLVKDIGFIDNTIIDKYFDTTYVVDSGSMLVFSIISNTNVDWSSIKTNFKAYYLNTSSFNIDTNSYFYSIKFNPVIFYNIYQQCQKPSKPIIALTSNVIVEPNLQFTSTNYSGNVLLSVKKRNKSIIEKQLTITNGIIYPDTFHITNSSNDTLYFDYYSEDMNLDNKIVLSEIKINDSYKNAGFYTHVQDSMQKFGNLNRGWGQFSYKPNSDDNFNKIDESKLVVANGYVNNLSLFPTIDTSQSVGLDTLITNYLNSLQNIFSINNLNDPVNNIFSIMTPDMDSMVWRGYANITMVGKTKMSNEELAVDSITEEFDYPIPTNILNPFALAPIKMNESTNNSFSLSAGGLFNLGFSGTSSKSESLLDFIDLNGDRYPDFVGTHFAQLTNPQGGFYNIVRPEFNNNECLIYQNRSYAIGKTYGVTYPKTIKTITNDAKTSKITVNASGSLGYGSSFSIDSSPYSFIDMNGDGLPDKVHENGTVSLNMGNYYAAKEMWFLSDYIRTGGSYGENASVGGSISADYNNNETSFSGGISPSKSKNYNSIQYLDINGDGLSDKICWSYGSLNKREMFVYINTGNGFVSYDGNWLLNQSFIENSFTYSENANMAFTAGIAIPIIPNILSFKVVVNPKIYFNKSYTKEKVQLTDVNADGYLDIATSEDQGSLKVRYSTLGKQNLLRKVSNSVGSSFEIDYTLSDNSVKSPQRNWQMTYLQVNDGVNGDGADSAISTFEYKNSYYSRSERISFGYDTVITHIINTMDDTLGRYRNITEAYHNDKYLFKGIKKYELLTDNQNRKWVETVYTYKPKRITTGEVVADTNIICFTDLYPAISREDKYYYDVINTSFIIHTQKQYTHGRWANVILYKDLGDLADVDDDLTAYISYDTIIPLNLLSLQKNIIVKHNSTILRSRSASYFQNNGKLQQIILNNNNATSQYDYLYNSYGDISSVTLPENMNQERKTLEFGYNTSDYLPVKVNDNIGYDSRTEYDNRFGKPSKTIDISGNEINYTYDGYGRLKTVQGPYEIENNIPYTIKFDYWDDRDIMSTDNDKIPWARTRHYDPLNTGNEITTVLFTDGLGRELQLKKNAVIYDPVYNIEIDSVVVSGRVIYDPYGRITDTYLPITEDLGKDSLFNYNFNPLPPARTTYDILDRTISSTSSDNKTSWMIYSLDADYTGLNKFTTVNIDPKSIVSISFKDSRNLLSSFFDASGNTTIYKYNALGELTSTTDPENNTTTHKYDMLGRRTQRTHPDAGTTTYTYDNANNLTSLKTQNLNNLSEKITYKYYYNQLMGISYPFNPENNVYYKYGSSGNEAGRIIFQQDASGVQEFYYGKLGELTKNIHTFVMPAGETYTFETRWEYDSWNRLKTISYPDGEKLRYIYNNGGQLASMSGEKSGISYNYINYLGYDKYEKRLRIDYGNNTYANYQYNPLNLQLTNLTSYNSQSEEMQNISYSYDDVNNITSVSNTANQTSNGMGGNYSYEYTYDFNYRLTESYGSFNGNGFSLNMEYSPSGNITKKQQYAQTSINGNNILIDYRRDYNYNSNQPHAVEQINNNEISFNWDANGNLLDYHIQGRDALDRNHCWDEENRLMAVKDQNYLSHYIYDAGGERVWKITGEVQRMQINKEDYIDYVDMNNHTLYANPYFVANDREYSKHYYIEGQRICSKLGGGLANSLIDFNVDVPPLQYNYDEIKAMLHERILRNSDCVKQKASYVSMPDRMRSLDNMYDQDRRERDLYFYHSDHLGSSSFITDADGITTQHLQYLPYGELFVEQRATANYFTPYKFSAKEKDEETSYSYFGARYLASDFSLWLSVDPMADKYPSMSPYMYCAGNPVMLVDPDGREIWITGDDGQKTKYDPGMKYEGKDAFTTKALNSLNDINGKSSGGNMVNELVNSKNIFNIVSGNKSDFKESDNVKAYANQLKTDQTLSFSLDYFQNNGIDISGGSGGTITWNSEGTLLPTTRGNQSNSTSDLAHELFHGLDANRGLLDNRSFKHIDMRRFEWQACYRENVLRQEMKLPLRTYYRVQHNQDGSIEGLFPRILNGGNKPFLPQWYKP